MLFLLRSSKVAFTPGTVPFSKQQKHVFALRLLSSVPFCAGLHLFLSLYHQTLDGHTLGIFCTVSLIEIFFEASVLGLNSGPNYSKTSTSAGNMLISTSIPTPETPVLHATCIFNLFTRNKELRSVAGCLQHICNPQTKSTKNGWRKIMMRRPSQKQNFEQRCGIEIASKLRN